MELGLGIHGEPGVTRSRLQPADQLTEMLLAEILNHRRSADEKRLAVMINNLGATTEMELAIVARHASFLLEKQRFTVERIYVGTFPSSLDMAGISISVLGLNEDRLQWLDAPTTARVWPNMARRRPRGLEAQVAPTVSVNRSSSVRKVETQTGRRTKRIIDVACEAVIEAESELTELDRLTGDGDLGTNMKRAAAVVRAAVESYLLDDVAATLKAVGHTLRRELDGSSVPLYGVLFMRSGKVLGESGWTGLLQWARALEEGCLAISELGGAKPGDRTMLDALDPFVRRLKSAEETDVPREVLLAAVDQAE